MQMEMELSEIHNRVSKLEEILTELAKWTHFDMEKFTNTTHDAAESILEDNCNDIDVDDGHVFKIEVEVDDDITISDDDGEEKRKSSSSKGPATDIRSKIKTKSRTRPKPKPKERRGLIIQKVAVLSPSSTSAPLPLPSPFVSMERLPLPSTCTSTSTQMISPRGKAPPPHPKAPDQILKKRRGRPPNMKSSQECQTDHTKTCYFCQKEFKRNEHMLIHLRIHTDERPYKCCSCPYDAKKYSNLARHVRSTHSSQPLNQGQNQRKIQCPKCPCMFRSASALSKHIPFHKNRYFKSHGQENQNKTALGDGQGNSHLQLQTSRNKNTNLYECVLCPYATGIKSRLLMHERIHTGEKPFKCEKCGYETGHPYNFKRHVVESCKGKIPISVKVAGVDLDVGESGGEVEVAFLCEECGQKFTSVATLKRHKSVWHGHPTKEKKSESR